MAYLPDFKYDIYLSYIHSDNWPDAGSHEGWVDVFHKYLEVELSKLIGEFGVIKIWKNITGDEGFFTALARVIEESAIFVALISNSYLSSTYCQTEMRTFYREPKRVRLESQSRFFVVELERNLHGSWRTEASNHPAYSFYDEDHFGRAVPGTDLFQNQIRLLARDIFKTLQSLRDASADLPKPNEIEKPAKSAVFISYRRGESTPYAGRLYDQLAAHFGDDRVFMDLDTIEPGDDFVEVITNYVSSCSILIALINKTWLDATDDEGRRQLQNPEDFVNLEISIALKRNIRVIPVLVQGTSMPRPQDLPESLSRLSRRNALELSDSRWKYDVGKLIKVLEKYL